MGVNAEMITFTHEGFVSDRLDNPKFCGPADGLTGIAPGWHPITHNMGGMHCKLVAGMSLSGSESQMVHVYGGHSGRGIVQKGIGLKADEDLEVEMWAKVRHHPVTLQLSLGSSVRSVTYDKAELTIDAAYWKRYTLRLHAPREDRNATFMITFITDGQVLFDQVHMRPVGASHVSAEMLELLDELRLPNVRFPGGSMAANYYWRHGTGPVHLRPSLPDACFKWRMDYEFGIDEYLQMCIDQQQQPFITVNIGSATPEDIGEQAAYCAEFYRKQGLEPPQAFFMIGNEHYGAWEPAHMTAEMYVEVLRAFVPFIRAHYPASRIIALGHPESVGVGGPHTPLRKSVLQDVPELFDILAIHFYGSGWSEDPEEWASLAAANPPRIRGRLQQLLDDCREAGSEAKLALTEWGFRNEAMHWDGKKFFDPDDAAHGIYFAGMIHVLASFAPHLEVANYYNLINAMGMVRNDGGFVSGTGVSDLYQLYRPAFPSEWLPVSIESPKFANEVSMLDALAVRAEGSNYLFLSNRSVTHELEVHLNGWEGSGRTIKMLKAEAMDIPHKEVSPPQLEHHALKLPPLSVVRIQWMS